MNSFAEHPPFTLLIMFILLIMMLFVSNHQLKQTNASVWMVMMIVCFIHSYCFWNLCIHSPFIHQLPFIRSIDVHHPFIQHTPFNGLWCGVVGGVVNDVGVQDAMEPNEVMWRVLGDEVVVGECGAASDAFRMMWNQMRCGGVG